MEFGNRRGAYVLAMVSTLCICSAFNALAVFCAVQRNSLGPSSILLEIQSDSASSGSELPEYLASEPGPYALVGNNSTRNSTERMRGEKTAPAEPLEIEQVRFYF